MNRMSEIQENLLRAAIQEAEQPEQGWKPDTWALSVKRMYEERMHPIPVLLEEMLDEYLITGSTEARETCVDRLIRIYEQMTWLPYIPGDPNGSDVLDGQDFVWDLEEYSRLFVACIESEEQRQEKMDLCKVLLWEMSEYADEKQADIPDKLEQDYLRYCVMDAIKSIRPARLPEDSEPDPKQYYENYAYSDRVPYKDDRDLTVMINASRTVRAGIDKGRCFLEFGWAVPERKQVFVDEPVYDLALCPALDRYVLAVSQHRAAVYDVTDGSPIWELRMPHSKVERPQGYFACQGQYLVANNESFRVKYEGSYREAVHSNDDLWLDALEILEEQKQLRKKH